jgi:predicted metal-dependent hydrolase
MSLLHSEYLAFRFRLASEAIERLLKAHTFLATGWRSKLRRKDLHNPFYLKQELNAVRHDKKLDTFDELLHKLYDITRVGTSITQ